MSAAPRRNHHLNNIYELLWQMRNADQSSANTQESSTGGANSMTLTPPAGQAVKLQMASASFGELLLTVMSISYVAGGIAQTLTLPALGPVIQSLSIIGDVDTDVIIALPAVSLKTSTLSVMYAFL